MRAMIIGCGRVGSGLANDLNARGHHVIVLDREQQAFQRLPDDFTGERIVGNGMIEEYVRPTLEQKIDCLFVMTDKDNVNLMIGQWAKKKYPKTRVIVEVHDSRLAALYRELGLETVCPADLMLHQLKQMVE